MERSFEVRDVFRNHLRFLSLDEKESLKENIIENGCLDPLVIWDEENCLIDGHNRLMVCENEGIEFETKRLSFASEDDVLDWIDHHQLSRRNLSPDDFKIVSGRIYNRRKKNHGNEGGDLDRTKLSAQSGHLKKTCDQVANEIGVSKNTIRRNGQRAEVFDNIESIDEEAADYARKAPQKDIEAVKGKSPEEQVQELLERKAVYVSHNSGVEDWYTPYEYIEAARDVMGEIDTDPASSDIAQKNVQAKTYFTVEDDGLEQEWTGNVWMNPPYTTKVIDRFCKKLVEEIDIGNVQQAIVLVNNATETKWMQSLLNNCQGICFPRKRVRFLRPNGEPGQPLQGQAVVYFGCEHGGFVDVFSKFGFCREVSWPEKSTAS